jgi:hypothetical protein
MLKSACDTGDTQCDATILGQGVSMDFGFIIQRSNNIERYKSLIRALSLCRHG